jgi:hypothetical protein
MLQNTEKLSAPRMNTRSHHTPCGRRRANASNNRPAGSARSKATVIAGTCGSSCVVTM